MSSVAKARPYTTLLDFRCWGNRRTGKTSGGITKISKVFEKHEENVAGTAGRVPIFEGTISGFFTDNRFARTQPFGIYWVPSMLTLDFGSPLLLA